MSKPVVLTAIYKEFWGTEHFRKSVQRVGLDVYNVFPANTPHKGNGFIYGYFYNAFLYLRDKCETVIYSDGADTIFQRAFEPPNDEIIYSTEKQIWPPVQQFPHLQTLYDEYYHTRGRNYLIPLCPWKFLNGGNWCGPIDLLIEWYDKYGLKNLTGDINGQKEQAEAFMKADKDGFPIRFDLGCEYFQTTAFENRGDFGLAEDGKTLINNITGTIPCVLHGNGRTDMTPIYERWK
jgi:hypothetical protein